MFPPNTVGIGLDSEGNVTSILCYLGDGKTEQEPENLIEYLKQMLGFISEYHWELSTKVFLNDEESVLLSIYESYCSILDVLETAFAEQGVSRYI